MDMDSFDLYKTVYNLFFLVLWFFSGSTVEHRLNTYAFIKTILLLILHYFDSNVSHYPGAPNENVDQNHLNVALLNVF